MPGTTPALLGLLDSGAGHHIHGEVYRVDGSHVPQEPRASLTKHMTQLDFFFFWWRHSGSIGYLGMCWQLSKTALAFFGMQFSKKDVQTGPPCLKIAF